MSSQEEDRGQCIEMLQHLTFVKHPNKLVYKVVFQFYPGISKQKVVHFIQYSDCKPAVHEKHNVKRAENQTAQR